MIVDIIFMVLMAGSLIFIVIASYIDETPTGIDARTRQHQARRQVELNRHRLQVRRDADATLNDIDRAIRRRRRQ
jgi:hypothetical protein